MCYQALEGLDRGGGRVVRNVERERAWDKRMVRIGLWIEALAYGSGTNGLPDGKLTGLTIRLPTGDRPETLIVIRACSGGQDYVAFCGALELSDALLTWRAKDGAKGVRWRVDEPWGDQATGR